MKKIIILMALVFVLSIALVSADIAWREDVVVRDSSDWDSTTTSYSLVNQNPDPAEPGEYVELRFKAENLGGAAAEDVIFEIIPSFPFSLDPGTSPQVSIGSIDAQQVGEKAYIVYYKLKVDEKAVEGNNLIRLKYSLNNGNTWILLDPFTVRVQTSDSIIAVESVVSEPEIVEPGQKAKLTIRLKNQADNVLKNLRVNLELKEELTVTTSITQIMHPFTPLGSSNEKAYSTIPAGETVNVVFDLIADPDGTIGVHKIPLQLTYTDNIGTSYSQEYLIGLIIGEKPDLIITVDEDEMFTAGSTQDVVIQFVNKGNSDLKFVNVDVHENGDFKLLSQHQVYVGNIDSDDFETAEFKIYFEDDAPETVAIPFTLEYKDANNNYYKQEKEAHVRLYTSEEVALTQPPANYAGLVVIFLLVVAAIIIGIVWWRKRKKKKR